MAGMLPGVECARRRRFHGSGPSTESSSAAAAAVSGHGSTRRPTFCLYASNRESHHSFSRNVTNKAYREDLDEKLGGAAREAKERLDERLRNQRKSDGVRRQSSKEKLSVVERVGHGELPMEVFGSRKTRGRLISWLGWRAGDQEDCAICLERFKTGETLVNLPCAHRFHSRCLVPWLDNNVHCPYCRMDIWS